jgi:hypothetical protein
MQKYMVAVGLISSVLDLLTLVVVLILRMHRPAYILEIYNEIEESSS